MSVLYYIIYYIIIIIILYYIILYYIILYYIILCTLNVYLMLKIYIHIYMRKINPFLEQSIWKEFVTMA